MKEPRSTITTEAESPSSREANPIVRARELCGLNRQEFANALRLSYGSVLDPELGRVDRLRPRVRAALADAGFDADRMAEEYDAWYRARAASYDDRLRAGREALSAREGR